MRFWLALLTMTAALLVFGHHHHAARAHNSPSGKPYPGDCCQGDNHTGMCHPVECDQLEQQGDRIVWKPPDGRPASEVVFQANRLRPSFDQFCHVCVEGGKDGSAYASMSYVAHCVYLRQSAQSTPKHLASGGN